MGKKGHTTSLEDIVVTESEFKAFQSILLEAIQDALRVYTSKHPNVKFSSPKPARREKSMSAVIDSLIADFSLIRSPETQTPVGINIIFPDKANPKLDAGVEQAASTLFGYAYKATARDYPQLCEKLSYPSKDESFTNWMKKCFVPFQEFDNVGSFAQRLVDNLRGQLLGTGESLSVAFNKLDVQKSSKSTIDVIGQMTQTTHGIAVSLADDSYEQHAALGILATVVQKALKNLESSHGAFVALLRNMHAFDSVTVADDLASCFSNIEESVQLTITPDKKPEVTARVADDKHCPLVRQPAMIDRARTAETHPSPQTSSSAEADSQTTPQTKATYHVRFDSKRNTEKKYEPDKPLSQIGHPKASAEKKKAQHHTLEGGG